MLKNKYGSQILVIVRLFILNLVDNGNKMIHYINFMIYIFMNQVKVNWILKDIRIFDDIKLEVNVYNFN